MTSTIVLSEKAPSDVESDETFGHPDEIDEFDHLSVKMAGEQKYKYSSEFMRAHLQGWGRENWGCELNSRTPQAFDARSPFDVSVQKVCRNSLAKETKWNQKPFCKAQPEELSVSPVHCSRTSSFNPSFPTSPFQLQRLPLWMGSSHIPLGQTSLQGEPCIVKLEPKGPEIEKAFLKSLGVEILAFTEWIQLTKEELQERCLFANQVKNIISCLWPDSTVAIYGSSEAGLALPSSDVDFVVSGIPFSRFSSSHYLNELSRALHGYRDLQVIPSAKVPIVKFRHPQSGICGDISLCVPHATKSVALVKSYLSTYPLALPLIFVVKTLLRQGHLNSPKDGGLSSYAITLLVVCFLRICNDDPKAPCNMNDQPSSLGLLLVKFLWFFASDELNCIFTPGGETPFVLRDADCIPIYQGRLEVRDPLDYNNNVTRNCTRFSLVRHVFFHSLKALTLYSPVHCPSILSAFINPGDQDFIYRVYHRSLLSNNIIQSWQQEPQQRQAKTVPHVFFEARKENGKEEVSPSKFNTLEKLENNVEKIFVPLDCNEISVS